jgi:hypothetical protein
MKRSVSDPGSGAGEAISREFSGTETLMLPALDCPDTTRLIR